MKRGFFVTGTDTNVGKTIVSAALVCALREQTSVCYWKPIQTGIESDNDTQTIQDLANCAKNEIYNFGYRLNLPLSPHLSARLANVEIETNTIMKLWSNAPREPFWIVEGAGGVFVPLNENELIIDLIEKINLPVVIAARSSLGTINHTLLTTAALRARNLEIAGVVLSGELNSENRLAIEHYGKIQVLGELPLIDNLNFKTLSQNACVALKTIDLFV